MSWIELKLWVAQISIEPSLNLGIDVQSGSSQVLSLEFQFELRLATSRVYLSSSTPFYNAWICPSFLRPTLEYMKWTQIVTNVNFDYFVVRLADPRGDPFEVQVARFPLELPDYVFWQKFLISDISLFVCVKTLFCSFIAFCYIILIIKFVTVH